MLGYHVTRKESSSSIRATGLEPRIGILSQELGEPVPQVFLFSSSEEAENGLMNWLGEAYCDLEEEEGRPIPLLILEVDLAGLVKEQDARQFFEIALSHPVPPERIVRTFSEAAFTRWCDANHR